MLTKQRRGFILNLLEKKGSIAVAEVQELLNVSASTV